MVHRKGLVCAAACAALTAAGIVRAESNVVPANDGLSLQPVYLDAGTTAPASAPATAPAPPPFPLMALLELAGIGKPLEAANIRLGGYVDVGYNVSLLNPGIGGATGSVGGRFQDNFSNRVKLDQLDFFFDKPVDYSKPTIDVGGHFEVIYGRDTDFFHSTGIYDNPNTFGESTNPAGSGSYYGHGAPAGTGATQPENQFDINQAYIDIALPIGTGLRARLGKFVTLLGYETINPTTNPFFSHSFLFTYAIPLTQTGVMFEYKPNADWQIDGGFTLGWSQSLRDNNGDIDFLGGITWTPQESDFLKKINVIVNLSEGPQGTNDSSDYWTVIDLIAKYTALGDGTSPGSLLVAMNMDYGDVPHANPSNAAQWFGAAGYIQYIAASTFTINARLEWYDDASGFTLAGYVPQAPGAGGTYNLYEATIGAAITPLPDDPICKNLIIRPELRVDYSGKPFFPGNNSHFQSTFGVDLYFVY